VRKGGSEGENKIIKNTLIFTFRERERKEEEKEVSRKK